MIQAIKLLRDKAGDDNKKSFKNNIESITLEAKEY
jgi:hypothetical protein